MGKRIKSIALSVIAAVFGVLALSGPVFATPNTGNDNAGNTTTVTDEPGVTTPDSTDTDNTTDAEEDEESEVASCYDQVGSLGWIICPGAGLFGNVIDGAYDILTQIIEVNPIPTDTTSPTYVVWEYFKDITNSIFIIFLLVITMSQITGYGMNNYGIKKALPRIIISAILVNLSYIICTIAVDLSNVLGNAFQGFFENIQNIAIQNGTISDTASGASVAGIVAAMLGIGTAGAVFAGAVVYGSIGGVIWMLLPVLLSGLIAVISAVVTMAARQALIYILVMISPLALIAYMLPNTEKWYKKWFSMLTQMLFFYPMFSILYGASQLAGLVIITSATNWLGVVLGIAVKILPLFMSIPLMRMSHSALGAISGFIGRAAARPQGAFTRYSMSQQALAKQNQLNRRNPILPSTRLAQYLDRQRVRREFDTNELAANNKDRALTSAMTSWRNRNGQLNRRGIRHYENERTKMDYATARINVLSDFDEGFKTDGTDTRVRTRDLARVAAINTGYEHAIVNAAAAESRKRVVARNNIESRAETIRQNVEQQGNEIHQRVLDSFNIDAAQYDTVAAKKEAYESALRKSQNHQTLNAQEQAALNAGPLTQSEKAFYDTGRQAINFTLSDAIASRRKLDNEARSIYQELYDDSPAGLVPGNALTEALKSGDYNSMRAAIEVMAKRGDHKDIMEILAQNSSNLVGADEASIRVQKEINDALLAHKGDNPILWAWAKANMIRRGKYNHTIAEGGTPKLEAFIDFDSFINGSLMPGDTLDLSTTTDASGNIVYVNQKDKASFDMINMESILTNVRDGKIFGGADRTMYNYFLSAGKNGLIAPNHYIFTDIKHLRASACSGQMDGEQLAAFNNYMTYGYSKNGDNTFFNAHRDEVHANLVKYFKDMTAGQLASVKTATLVQMNDAMLAINHDGVDLGGGEVSQELLDVLTNQRESLQKANMSTQRAGMNQSVRKMLGIDLT